MITKRERTKVRLSLQTKASDLTAAIKRTVLNADRLLATGIYPSKESIELRLMDLVREREEVRGVLRSPEKIAAIARKSSRQASQHRLSPEMMDLFEAHPGDQDLEGAPIH